MDQNRREHERFSVNLYVEHVERSPAPIRILNLSSSGFLVRGDVCAGQGGIFHARFRVRVSSGEMRVSMKGKVVHSLLNGQESEFGIKIEGFGSPAEESAYLSYVKELERKMEGKGISL